MMLEAAMEGGGRDQEWGMMAFNTWEGAMQWGDEQLRPVLDEVIITIIHPGVPFPLCHPLTFSCPHGAEH